VRYVGAAYRAHDPRWSYRPISGDGAAIHGGRFNPAGSPALYMSLEASTAIREASQGFARKMEPLVLCSYEVDCEDIVDLTDQRVRRDLNVAEADLAAPWFALKSAGKEPPQWALLRRLRATRTTGVLVPSFAPGADATDKNLVLWDWWDWGPTLPHRVDVFDPSGRLPKNQLSWD
jgi:RES domain-containing protein